jgi:protoheme IX farnesyltransferase
MSIQREKSESRFFQGFNDCREISSEMKLKAASYVTLIKPYIMLLVTLTGATSLVLEGSLLQQGWPNGTVRFGMILLALLLTGGSANAFNMYLERDIDAKMSRTREKRPLPLGLIKPRNALIFAIVLGIIGMTIFAISFNLLSAGLALSTILFYSFFYTIYLKPRTPYNIVIGGAAGSMAPVIAWAAVTNSLAPTSLLLSSIIFLWTPPHFWALALYMRSDYELVGYPMMPLACGERTTARQILIYVVALVILSAACIWLGAGILYAVIAASAGGILIYRAIRLVESKKDDLARAMFRYSIVYLLSIFIGLMIDSAIKISF